MDPNTKKPRPGDHILDEFVPGAAPEQREEARDNLFRLARLIMTIYREQESRPTESRTEGQSGVDSEVIPENP